MKLYTKVKSDRASKSQGGNKEISVDFFVGSRDNSIQVANVLLEKIAGGYALILTVSSIVNDCAGRSIFIPEAITKGKKQ